MKPRLLDLFCGAGGAAMGYHRAGFEVVGVGHQPAAALPVRVPPGGRDDVPAGWLRRDPRQPAVPGLPGARRRFASAG